MEKREKEQHEYFMRLALKEAEAAFAAGEFPVGCVVVEDNEIIGCGARVNSAVELSELDHAEIVALRTVAKDRPDTDFGRVTVYSTMEPCLMCYATLIVNGVKNVVYGYEDVMGGGTNLQLSALAPLYASIDMKVVGHILRNESLQLFQQFFRSDDNNYLQGTLLEEYTLQQK